MKKFSLLLVVVLLLSGCTSIEKALNDLPQISATRLQLSQSNTISSAQVEAENLVQTPTQATAERLTVMVTVPFFGTTSATFENYVREKRLNE